MIQSDNDWYDFIWYMYERMIYYHQQLKMDYMVHTGFIGLYVTVLTSAH